jgi:hypothetical protein
MEKTKEGIRNAEPEDNTQSKAMAASRMAKTM